MYVCELEQQFELPQGRRQLTTREFSSLRQRAEAACKSGQLLIDLGAEKENIDEEDEAIVAIANLVNKDAANKSIAVKDMENAFSSPAVAVRINSIMREYDTMIVENAVRIRNYVTNRLIEESTDKDPRIRMQALIQLGKITDVGLFTERTEVTLTNKTTTEIESALKAKLSAIMGKDTAVDAVEIIPVQAVNLEDAFSDE